MNDRVTLHELALMITAILALFVVACPPLAEPAVVSVEHNAALSQCRRSSEAYRDAGPDAEWSAYKACADKADKR